MDFAYSLVNSNAEAFEKYILINPSEIKKHDCTSIKQIKQKNDSTISRFLLRAILFYCGNISTFYLLFK